MSTPFKIGILGCGNISRGYGKTFLPYPHIHIAGAADIDPARAAAFVQEFGGTAYPTAEAMLADPSIDLVVNLTIHHAHYEVIRQCLHAGKHVFSEKPLALTYAEASALVTLAAERGLRLACAPITFLGEVQQTAWKLIREGAIGTPRLAYAEVNWARIEDWHPNPVPFYDVGPLFDVGVYPLTVVTAIFGPARRVTGFGTVLYPDRVTKEGLPFHLNTADFIVGIIEHAGGAVTRLTTNFYVPHAGNKQHGLEFHGDAGSLYMRSWHDFHAPLELAAYGQPYAPVEPVKPPYEGTEWSRGVVDMVEAIQAGRPQRATGAQAAHVVEIMEAIKASYTAGHPVAVQSDFPPPAPMDWSQ
ncbi:MAG: Gfo/Idh/MocA family oxidoreductase [Anaerolineae bacterium]|nr:Gfo/Idh/MocA family oxidoreductase [Anaerolineae bacterium]